MHRPLRRRGLAVVAAVALAAGLTACGDDDADDASADAGAEAEADGTEPADDAAPDAEVASVDDGDDVITVVAVDFAFENLPDSVAAGTRFELVNEAPEEVHEIVALRIPDDEDRSVEDLIALPPEEQAALFAGGPPAMVLVTPPGAPGFAAVGDGTLDEPGRYAFVCMIPTGADADEFMAAAAESEGPPDVAGGPPHIVHGMWAEVLVD
jgi:hypothetical protein